ncbi:MAG: hypothetical protein LBS59_00390 [Puniceicoccales bacterium]|jgi:hypothetical protein|nr:hypothetical protein [Puniceicoccales bacterium]
MSAYDGYEHLAKFILRAGAETRAATREKDRILQSWEFPADTGSFAYPNVFDANPHWSPNPGASSEEEGYTPSVCPLIRGCVIGETYRLWWTTRANPSSDDSDPPYIHHSETFTALRRWFFMTPGPWSAYDDRESELNCFLEEHSEQHWDWGWSGGQNLVFGKMRKIPYDEPPGLIMDISYTAIEPITFAGQFVGYSA